MDSIKRIKQIVSDNATIQNTHIIYFSIFLLVFLVNIIVNNHAPFDSWVEITGTIIQIAIPTYAFVPTIWKKDKNGFVQMVIILMTVIAITHFLKFIIPAPRPMGNALNSFPSGHTAAAFVGTVFLTIRYGWKYCLIFGPLACFVAFSRLYAHRHWPIDIIASIILCLIAGLLCVRKSSNTV